MRYWGLMLILTLLIGCANIEKPPTVKCENNPGPVFTSDITDMDKISMVVPPGTIEGTVLKTHSYVQVKERAPVYAPHDAYLYEGVKYTEEGMTQYSLFFKPTCEVLYIFDHIQEPVEKIEEAFPGEPQKDTRTHALKGPIFFKAGELVGYTTGTKMAKHFDFGVYNKGSSRLEFGQLRRDDFADCPYDYFPDEKREVYYSLFGSFISDTAPTTFCK